MKKVQLVFNEGVKVISGAFCTAPREPLHEILRVLPARHFLEKLIHTSALRLYRVPRGSQLMSRLGHEWDSSVQTGTDWVLPGPLTVHPGTGLVVPNSAPLPWRLSVRGCLQKPPVLTLLPWRPGRSPTGATGVNYWALHTQSNRRSGWTSFIARSHATSGAIIRVASTVSNKGRPDNRAVGACGRCSHAGGRSGGVGTLVVYGGGGDAV
jgi:hypothetical protein